MLYYTDEGELTYNHNKEYATQFDTKEEAERWCNPLTEAVKHNDALPTTALLSSPSTEFIEVK